MNEFPLKSLNGSVSTHSIDNLTLCSATRRLPEEQRPRPPEVLLTAHQDPDLHQVHRGVHLRQRQGHWPGLLRRLRGEGQFAQTAAWLLPLLHLRLPSVNEPLSHVVSLACWSQEEGKGCVSFDSFSGLCSLSSSYSFFPLIKSRTRAPR